MPILIIEDDGQVAALWVQALTRDGFDVQVAPSLKAACMALSHKEVAPFLAILVDLMLPNGAGVNVLKSVAAISNGSPLVVVTGYQEDGLREKCMAAGASAFLEKPVGIVDLVAAIRRVMAEKKIRDELAPYHQAVQIGLEATGKGT